MRAPLGGSGLKSEQLTNACSWMQGDANARSQVPMETFRLLEMSEEWIPLLVGGEYGIPRWAAGRGGGPGMPGGLVASAG